MYVRWRRVKLKSGDVSLRADVLQAYRNPMSGGPTSSLVACLGSIRTSNLKNPVLRELFWMGIENKLRCLDLPQHEERKIRESINRSVSRPLNAAAVVPTGYKRKGALPAAAQSQNEESLEVMISQLLKRIG
jgi:hypothetical protein